MIPIIAPQSLHLVDRSNNPITGLGPLVGHDNLSEVRLAHNPIVDLGQIAQAPWVLAGCAALDVRGNPLDGASVTTTLPAMCELDRTATRDRGSCAPEQLECGGPIRRDRSRGSLRAGSSP